MEIIKKNKYLIILLIFTSIFLSLSLGHYTNIYVDIGREMYYPLEILNGRVLYKDLFCIYGPFSYLLNALIYKIFGVKLASLYGIGVICAFSIVIFTYKIANKFLSNRQSFAVAFFVTSTGCLAARIFNFTLPYSYAMLFGICAFLISIYFLINFIENKKLSYFIISCIFCSIAVLNKYDFILYIIPFFMVLKRYKCLKQGLKWFSIPFIIIFLILVLQGLNFNDLFNAAENIKIFTHTQALKDFYITQGVYYTDRIWSVWFFDILWAFILILIISSGIYIYKKNKFFGGVLILLPMAGAFCFAVDSSYLYLVFLTSILFIFSFKKNTYCRNIFILSSILISLKSFWGLSHSNYGLYFIPVIFISFLILLKKQFIINAVCFLMLGACLNYVICDLAVIRACNTKIITNKGYIKTFLNDGLIANALIDFINNIKEDNPYVMIFPEGLSINFLAYKNTDAKGFYSSLIPLYVQGENDEKIADYYTKNPPLYLILSSIKNKDYNQGAICDTYAFKFCNFVYKNYSPFDKIEEKDITFFIFKLK